MKKYYSFLMALLLVCGNMKAEVPDGIWTMPDPSDYLEFTEFTGDGEHYILYNPAAKMFFASGNEWYTRASLASFGYEVWFTEYEESGSRMAPEGSFFFNNDIQHPNRQLGSKDLFTDKNGATWNDRYLDNQSHINYYWSLIKVGDYYRIQNVDYSAEEGNEGLFFGWKSGSDTRLYMIAPEYGTVDWQFVTVDSYEQFTYDEAYEAYQAGVETYFSGVALGTSLKEAETLGINIDEWLAVYTNTESTKEDLDAAKTYVDAVVYAKKILQSLVDAGAEVNAPIEEAQALLANADATADELNYASGNLNPIIEARKAYKKFLDEVKDAGFDATSDFDAVFENINATVNQINTALEELSLALIAWAPDNASMDKPVNFTGKIVNPNFDNASSSGWSGTAPNMVGSGSHGPANVCEIWNNTFDTYQDIIGLPAGVYALGAQTMWRGSWADMQNNIGPAAFLYAKAGDVESRVPFNYAYEPMNTESMAGSTYFGTSAGEQNYIDEETGITYYIPNDVSAFRLYAEKGLYDTKVLFVVNEGETVRIGVKNPAKLGDADNWSCFDTFTLTYYGTGADACQNYVNEAIQNFGAYEIEEGTLYTDAYLTAYNQASQGEKTASSMTEAEAVIGSANQAKADLDNNIELWKDYVKTCNTACAMRVDEDYMNMTSDEWLNLCNYLDEEYETIIEQVALSNEQLEAETAKVKNWIKAVENQEKLIVYIGKDMTKYIKNPGFDEDENINSGDAEGWTIDAGTGGNITRTPLGQGNKDLMEGALGEMNYYFEAWHSYGWDVWQEIENLPKGMYELQAQGFVRCEMAGYTRGDDLEGDYTSPVYLYLKIMLRVLSPVFTQRRLTSPTIFLMAHFP